MVFALGVLAGIALGVAIAIPLACRAMVLGCVDKCGQLSAAGENLYQKLSEVRLRGKISDFLDLKGKP